MIITFNEESLKRDGISHQDVYDVLKQSVTVEEGMSLAQNPTELIVGYTQRERMIEVGIEYMEDEYHIYHAGRATTHNQDRYHQLRTK